MACFRLFDDMMVIMRAREVMKVWGGRERGGRERERE